MALYSGIDLHGNNNVTLVMDDQDQVVYQKRLANHLPLILKQLAPFQSELEGIVVESTFNWYWLVDGLMEDGYRTHLANPCAIRQYSGLKYTNDYSDAQWVVHLLRLGDLPEGYIYPKEQRPLRDLLRKRGHLVDQRTANILSIQNIIWRNTGSCPSGDRIKQFTQAEIEALLPHADQALAVISALRAITCLTEQIRIIERRVQGRIKRTPLYELVQSVKGIGPILAQTILLETGDIDRFCGVGDYVSYLIVPHCSMSPKFLKLLKRGRENAPRGSLAHPPPVLTCA